MTQAELFAELQAIRAAFSDTTSDSYEEACCTGCHQLLVWQWNEETAARENEHIDHLPTCPLVRLDALLAEAEAPVNRTGDALAAPAPNLSERLYRLFDEMLRLWDSDQDAKLGKILVALNNPSLNYRADITSLRAILSEPSSAVLLPRAEVEQVRAASEALLVWLDDSYPHLSVDSTVDDFRSACEFLDRCGEGSRTGGYENPGSPDDLRVKGWTVAVHNDYRLGGEAFTFWLFTQDGLALKGEGRTDAEALNSVRSALALLDRGGQPAVAKASMSIGDAIEERRRQQSVKPTGAPNDT